MAIRRILIVNIGALCAAVVEFTRSILVFAVEAISFIAAPIIGPKGLTLVISGPRIDSYTQQSIRHEAGFFRRRSARNC